MYQKDRNTMGHLVLIAGNGKCIPYRIHREWEEQARIEQEEEADTRIIATEEKNS